MILIGGCSWACGEFGRPDSELGIVFPGLEYNFQQDNIKAVNLGKRAASNLSIAWNLVGWLRRNSSEKIDKIFVVQTDWIRDSKMIFEEDFSKITTATDLQNIYISRFYSRLSEISSFANAPVYLIGGVSDTLWLDNFQDFYPGVHILCQSWVNFCINDSHRIDDPVHSYYAGGYTEEIVKKIKPFLSDQECQHLLDLVDKGLERETLIFSTPEYFWPDGIHPNRYASAKLYNLIKQELY